VRFRRRARCTKRELCQAEGDPLPFAKPDIDWRVADLYEVRYGEYCTKRLVLEVDDRQGVLAD